MVPLSGLSTIFIIKKLIKKKIITGSGDLSFRFDDLPVSMANPSC